MANLTVLDRLVTLSRPTPPSLDERPAPPSSDRPSWDDRPTPPSLGRDTYPGSSRPTPPSSGSGYDRPTPPSSDPYDRPTPPPSDPYYPPSGRRPTPPPVDPYEPYDPFDPYYPPIGPVPPPVGGYWPFPPVDYPRDYEDYTRLPYASRPSEIQWNFQSAREALRRAYYSSSMSSSEHAALERNLVSQAVDQLMVNARAYSYQDRVGSLRSIYYDSSMTSTEFNRIEKDMVWQEVDRIASLPYSRYEQEQLVNRLYHASSMTSFERDEALRRLRGY